MTGNSKKPNPADAAPDEPKAGAPVREAADSAGAVGVKLKDGAEKIADQAKEAASETAETVGRAADRVGDSLRSVAGDLKDGSLQERTFGQIAQSLADVSDALREKEIGQMGRDVADFARRNPVLFAGAAALLGYAVVRMMSGDRDKT